MTMSTHNTADADADSINNRVFSVKSKSARKKESVETGMRELGIGFD